MHVEPTPRIFIASLSAGPPVIAFLMIAQWSTLFTDPITIPIGMIPLIPFVLIIAAAVGLGPALLANAIGSVVMIKLGNWFPLLRFPLVWAAAGGGMSWATASQFEAGPHAAFAFAAAGALSALICRMRLA